MKIVTYITSVLWVFTSHFALASIESSRNNILALDSREHFNTRAVNLRINQREYVIYESIADFSFSHIGLTISQIDTSNIDAPLLLKQHSLISDAQFNTLVGLITHKGRSWLYYLQSDSWRGHAKLLRAKITDKAKLAEPQHLDLPFKLSQLSNPSLLYSQGVYHLAFVSSTCCELAYATSTDGISFNKQVTLPVTGAMPEINVFEDDVLLYSYQRAFATEKINKKGKPIFVMKSRFLLSFDQGKSWQNEHLVSNAVAEVHDAFPVKRLDGAIDLYYSHSFNREGKQLSLWRRCVNSKGNVGKESLVAGRQIGNIAKPNVYRRPDGKLALLFSEQGKNVSEGSIQSFTVIEQDAECRL